MKRFAKREAHELDPTQRIAAREAIDSIMATMTRTRLKSESGDEAVNPRTVKLLAMTWKNKAKLAAMNRVAPVGTIISESAAPVGAIRFESAGEQPLVLTKLGFDDEPLGRTAVVGSAVDISHRRMSDVDMLLESMEQLSNAPIESQSSENPNQ
jgi:hypothetical protein